MSTTEATLHRHLNAFGDGIDTIMRDYAESSVLFTSDGPIKGLAAIRNFFDTFLRTSPPELLRAMTVTREDIDGEIAFIMWKAEPFIPLAADTFLIRDGKILAQSIALLAPTPAVVP